MMSELGWLDSYTEELGRDVVALFRNKAAVSVPREVIDCRSTRAALINRPGCESAATAPWWTVAP
jgi:hypothetical protein